MKEYKESNLYALGEYFEEIGKLLKDKNTTVNDIADFGIKHNVNPMFRILPSDEKPQSEDGV